MKVVINGAGIGGTALAYWLHRLGHDVTLVERAPRLRSGGFVINLWGIGYDALEKMGLLPALLEQQHVADALRKVDAAGRTRGGYPSSVLKTALGVRLRDYATLLMRLPVFPTLLMGRYFHDEATLPDYGI